MNTIFELRAKVYLLKSEEGGRRSPVASGYSPGFDFGVVGSDGRKMQNGGVMILEGREQLAPGEESVVRIRPLIPELIHAAVQPTLEFNVMEGGRAVGRGAILEVLIETSTDGATTDAYSREASAGHS